MWFPLHVRIIPKILGHSLLSLLPLAEMHMVAIFPCWSQRESIFTTGVFILFRGGQASGRYPWRLWTYSTFALLLLLQGIDEPLSCIWFSEVRSQRFFVLFFGVVLFVFFSSVHV